METIVSVAKSGRVVLPKEVRKKLGLTVGEGGIVSIEIRESDVILKRSRIEKSPSNTISKMNLPVSRWSRIEREIQEGTLKD